MSSRNTHFTKRLVNKALSTRYHHIQKKQAIKALNEVSKSKGPLPRTLRKQAEEYAHEILGWKGYAPWLKVYASVSGRFKEGWIPDNYFGHVVVPKIQGDYGKASHLKAYNKIVFPTAPFPDLAYCVNGIYVDAKKNPLDVNMLRSLLMKAGDRVVFKADHSFQGRDLKVLDPAKDMESWLSGKKKVNGVFQPFLRQHKILQAISPSAVATLRITTVLKNDGKTEIRAAYLRLGRISETHVQSASHIRIGVDIKSGELEETAFMPNWGEVRKHPDSGIVFKNKSVPNFPDCIEVVTTLHQQLPHVGCIGWDLTVDEQGGVQIMEWNGESNDIKFSEAIQGPCFADMGWEKLWRETE